MNPAIAEHPRRAELCALVHTLALTAADERNQRLGDGLEELCSEHGLGDGDGRMGEVDVLAALRGLSSARPVSRQESAAIAELLALSLREGERDEAANDALARSLCFLAAHTFLDAWPALDAALGAAAEPLWQAAFRLVRRSDGAGAASGRAEALTALAALAQSSSDGAQAALRVLQEELADPALRAAARVPDDESALAPADTPPDTASDEAEVDEDAATRPRPAREQRTSAPPRRSLPGRSAAVAGELSAAPLGWFFVSLGAVTGLLLVRALLRAFARWLFGARRPSEVTIEPAGITVKSRLDVLGRTVRATQTVIPWSNLARAALETRYPRLAMYAGLCALAVGTFLGASLIGDGGLGRSPSLIAAGAAIFGAGVAVDFALSSLWPSRRGRRLLMLVPRRGRVLALAVADAVAAENALRAVAAMSR